MGLEIIPLNGIIIQSDIEDVHFHILIHAVSMPKPSVFPLVLIEVVLAPCPTVRQE